MTVRPPDFVLDSYAVLAYLQGERSKARVVRLLEDAGAGRCSVHISLINLGEVLYIVERERGLMAAVRTLAAIEQLAVAHSSPAIPNSTKSPMPDSSQSSGCPGENGHEFARIMAVRRFV